MAASLDHMPGPALQVKDFLGKQGRQMCKSVIETAAKDAYLTTCAETGRPSEFNRDAVYAHLRQGKA